MTWQEVAFKIQAHRDYTISQINPAICDIQEIHSSRVLEIPGIVLTAEEKIITEYDIETLLANLASGKVSAVAVINSFLRRAAVSQKLTNCVYELLPTRALTRAKELDAALLKNGIPTGPLHGLPISVKEHIGMKGLPNTAGFVGWEGKNNNDDSEVLKILLAAGAILSNITGVTTNPHNTELTCGGSSGGEAALLALGGSVLGIGSDIGGSIRSPAANCGIYGFKPTAMRLPLVGLAACMLGCDMIAGTIGPMSRTLDGIELFMKVVLDSKPWEKDLSLMQMPWRSPNSLTIASFPKRKLTIGVILDDGIVKPSPPVARALRVVVEKLKLLPDVEVMEWHPHKHEYGMEILKRLYAPDGGEGFFDALKTSGEPVEPLLAWTLRDQAGVESLDHYGVRHWSMEREIFRYEYLQKWNQVAPEMDVILCPAGPLPAPPHNTSRYWGYTSIWNLLDYPAIVFPVTKVDPELDVKDLNYVPKNDIDCWYYNNYNAEQQRNVPVALQIVAKKMEDEKTVQSLKIIKNLISLPLVN